MRQTPKGRFQTYVFLVLPFGLLSAAGVLLAGCRNSDTSAPPTPRKAIELHPVGPPSEQPNTTSRIPSKEQLAEIKRQHEADAAGIDRSIEKMDLKDAIAKVFLQETKSNSLEEACKDTYAGQQHSFIDYVDAAFGDLDGDGKEEAFVTATSCLIGSGGPDLEAVFKLGDDGKLRQLNFDVTRQTGLFKGKDFNMGLRGRMRAFIAEGKLVEEFPIYTEHDSNCCATGGLRQFIFRWNGRKLALEKIVDLP